MEAVARVRFARMSPRKARLVADMVRGRKVSEAMNLLHFTPKYTARVMEKLLKSARSNAESKNVADPDGMKIMTIFVDKGPVMRRQLARARGRANQIRKPFSHVTIVLKEAETARKKTAKGKEAKAQAKPAGSETPPAARSGSAEGKAKSETEKAGKSGEKGKE